MPPGSPDRWETLSEHLDRLLELDEAERSAWLAQLGCTDPDMATRLSRLLAERQQDGFSQFLQGAAAPLTDHLGEATLVGRQVGPYVIDAEIGRGGMGSVWRAHRADGRFESQVAIKFVHAAWIGRSGEQRFRVEGNLLGQLNHPNIARLLDAGVLEATQPYLVLEYIQGVPIDEYCATHNLDVEARVRLFLEVLAAVAHAHSHLIVHRDIKPANIFVTDDGSVKLLDFGIAKLLDAGNEAATRSNAVALTPQFAAPEQLTGQTITTATDVYSLGLVLYLLLTGRHPLASDSRSGAEWMQAVLRQDPPRASTVAALPAVRPRALQGDLDNILLKALKKAPAERYASVAAFAADLGGYLNHEPISARPDTFTYVIGKLVRKHRLQVGAASITLLALIAGVVGTTLQAREAQRQRIQAVAERDRARLMLERHDAIFDFVYMMLTESVPEDQVPAMVKMLDRGTQLVEIAAAGQPERQAEILDVLAQYYTALDNAQQSALLLQRARQLLRSSPDKSMQAEVDCDYGTALNIEGRGEEAVQLFARWATDPAVDGNNAAFCLQSWAVVAQNRGNAQDALTYTDLAMKRVDAALVPSGRMRAELTADRGFALHLAGRNADAEDYFQSALEQYRTLGLENNHLAKVTKGNWGVVAYGSGDYRKGLQIYEDLWGVERRLANSGPLSPGLWGNLAHGLEAMGRLQEALQAYEGTYDSAVKTGFLGGQGYALVGKASVLLAQGEVSQAQASLDHAKTLIEGKVPETSPIQLRRLLTQAHLDAVQGHNASAMTTATHIIDLMNARNGQTNPAVVAAYRQRAELEVKQGQGDAATSDARKAVDIARSLQARNRYSIDTGSAYLTLGSVLEQTGDKAGARTALQSAVDHLSNAAGDQLPDTRHARQLLAQL
ncbi:MAG TPA: protein kinase [Steroidobacteraceae bacterium]|nr:protein kinase [Steroidobacteraceae bacterium]